MTSERRQKGIFEYLNYVTPVFLFVLTLYVNAITQNENMVLAKVNDIDQKLFKHLTNDELHSPRSLMMTKAEFEIYEKMRDEQFGEIRTSMSDIKEIVKEHSAKDKK